MLEGLAVLFFSSLLKNISNSSNRQEEAQKGCNLRKIFSICLLNLKKARQRLETREIIEFNVISRNSPFYRQHILSLWDELIELSISWLQQHGMMQLHPFHVQLKGFFLHFRNFHLPFSLFLSH